MYRPAVLLAYYGRVVEAIEEAERIRIEHYGSMNGVRFRVSTATIADDGIARCFMVSC